MSPIPGFRHWLDGKLNEPDKDAEAELLSAAERKALATAAGTGTEPAALTSLLQTPDWLQNQELAKALKTIDAVVRPLSCQGKARRRFGVRPRRPFSSVERRAHRTAELAGQHFASGIAQSAGLMVNYLYKLSDIEANHEAYRGEGKVMNSSAIRTLLKG